MLLNGCTTAVVINDKYQECILPEQPECTSDVCTDKATATYIASMGEKIEICRGLLGHDN